MKRLRTLLITFAGAGALICSFTVSPVAAQIPSRHAKPAVTFKVGLGVIGEVNDRGFNALANKGVKRAESRLHVKGTLVVAPNGGDYASTLNTFVHKHYNLIIATGALWDNAVYHVAKSNPGTHFAMVDGMPVDDSNKPARLSNVASLFFRSEQPGYLVGLIAGLMEKNKIGAAKHNTIGVMGALPLPFITSQMCGYYEGAKKVNKNITLVSSFANTFLDPEVGRNIGEQQISKNADILFGVADATGLGYYKAAQAHHKYAIGFAADQDYLGKHMLTSALVGVQTAVFRTIAAQLRGKLHAGAHYYGLKNGGVGYATDMHHVPAQIKKYVAAQAKRVANGKVKVSPTCQLPQ